MPPKTHTHPKSHQLSTAKNLDGSSHIIQGVVVSVSIVIHNLVVNLLRHVGDLVSDFGSCVDVAESIQVSRIGARDIYRVGLVQTLGYL